LLLVGWPENAEECIDIGEMVVHALESVGLVVELGQAVAGAVDYAEDLGHREHEVEDLWQEKEQHRLSEVAQDTNHGKSHACKVAEGITHEDFRGELIVLDKRKGHHDKGDYDSEREDVLRDDLRGGAQVNFLTLLIVCMLTITLCRNMKHPMTKLCPASIPLMPA